MKTGDLVKLTDKEGDRESSWIFHDRIKNEDRSVGTVLQFDIYRGLNSDFGAEQIVEILWNTGHTGWILASRIEVIND
jgi:hypothetical protein